ncbi:MAG: hypothetical protein F4107_08530 [Gemmatimonadetes bacterium]|nr:hypothetical protein [Gemmatimonadota bacterium]MYD13980.1 hypothetical protein [Gemmatimonadota bacterium]MYI65962.1 hypothetical protein [Gemmatimonadota bacterium]
MPLPLWGYAAVTIASIGVQLLLSRRKPDLERTGRASDRTSGPVQHVLGQTRVGGLRGWRVVDDSGRQYTTMENSPEEYRDVHLAIALSAGACEDLVGLYLDEVYYPLSRVSVDADGAVVYNNTLRRAPYASRRGNLFEVRGCLSATGAQGSLFRDVAGLSSSAPFMAGVSWAHVVLRQPSNAADPNRIHKYSGIPRIEFVMRGIRIPPAASPDAAARWSDDATDIRYWYMTERMGVSADSIDAASVSASRAITGAMVQTTLDGAWWSYADRPDPPNAAYATWSAAAPALTASNPVLWGAWSEKVDLDDATPLDRDAAADREWTIVPHRVRHADGTIVTLAGLPAATEADVLYRVGATGYAERRYTINGVIDSSQEHADVLGEMDAAWQGMVVVGADGKHHFRPGTDRPIARTWRADNVLSRAAVIGARIDRAVNVVHSGLEQSRIHGYRRHDLPALTDDAEVARDGLELPVRLRNMTLVNHPITAGRLLATFLRRARQSVAYRYRVAPDVDWQATNPGDAITVTDPFYGIEDRRMVVSAITVGADAAVTVTLVDAPTGAYADTIDLPDTVDDRPVVVNAVPAPADVALEVRTVNLMDGRSRAILAVSWTAQPYQVEIRYRITGLEAAGELPPGWERDPDSATRTVWREAAVESAPPALLSDGVDWGYTYQVQVRFLGRAKTGPWAAAVSVDAAPVLAETPDADAVIGFGRIHLYASAPDDRTIASCQFFLTATESLDAATITDEMVAAAVAAGLAPLLPVQPGEAVEGSTTRIPTTAAGDAFLGSIAARFISRTGARSAWASGLLAAPSAVQVPPDGYTVLVAEEPTGDERTRLASLKGRIVGLAE